MASPYQQILLPAPPPGSTRQQAQQFQAGQALLAAIVITDVIALWSGLGTWDVRRSWPPVRGAIARLVNERYAMSAQLGADFYAQMRLAGGVPGDFAAAIPEALSDLRVGGTLDATGPYSLLRDIKAGTPLSTAVQKAAVSVSGAASYLALEGGRQAVLQAVKDDPAAIAWARITTSGKPCSFCAMLASRGPVYKSERSASFQSHNHCACEPVCIFSEDDAKALTDKGLQAEWRRVTRGMSGAEARNAWRRYWDRKAIAA